MLKKLKIDQKFGDLIVRMNDALYPDYWWCYCNACGKAVRMHEDLIRESVKGKGCYKCRGGSNGR